MYLALGYNTIEPGNKEILVITVSKERNMFVAERFLLSDLIKTFEKYPVSTEGRGTWYSIQACDFLNLDHHIQSPLWRKV